MDTTAIPTTWATAAGGTAGKRSLGRIGTGPPAIVKIAGGPVFCSDVYGSAIPSAIIAALEAIG
jgi:hypothetical protein